MIPLKNGKGREKPIFRINGKRSSTIKPQHLNCNRPCSFSGDKGLNADIWPFQTGFTGRKALIGIRYNWSSPAWDSGTGNSVMPAILLHSPGRMPEFARPTPDRPLSFLPRRSLHPVHSLQAAEFCLAMRPNDQTGFCGWQAERAPS